LEQDTTSATASVPLLYTKQLQYIHKLADFARMRHLGLWICGGWAVEALTGEAAPRMHSNVDALVLRPQGTTLRAWLARHRFVFPGEMCHGFHAIRQTGGGPLELNFIYLDWDEEHHLATFLPEHNVLWPCEDPAEMQPAVLGGKPVPVCNWEMAYASSEMLKFIDPEHAESLDEAAYAEAVKTARRKAISKALFVPYKPSSA
jgi:hypothetical protein